LNGNRCNLGGDEQRECVREKGEKVGGSKKAKTPKDNMAKSKRNGSTIERKVERKVNTWEKGESRNA